MECLFSDSVKLPTITKKKLKKKGKKMKKVTRKTKNATLRTKKFFLIFFCYNDSRVIQNVFQYIKFSEHVEIFACSEKCSRENFLTHCRCYFITTNFLNTSCNIKASMLSLSMLWKNFPCNSRRFSQKIPLGIEKK